MRTPKHILLTAAVIAPGFILSMVALVAIHHPSPKVQHLALSSAGTSYAQKQAALGATTTTDQTTTANMPASTTTHSSSTTTTRTGSSSPTSTTSNPAPTNSPVTNNQSSSSPPSAVTTTTIHIGGYPPAIGAALTPDFEDPIHIPVSDYPQYPNAYANTNYSPNSYEWVETKYCAYTYADGHTFKHAYQYLAYQDIYANSDGSLNPNGINMAVTSNPTTSCDVAHAPKSVFEPNYTY